LNNARSYARHSLRLKTREARWLQCSAEGAARA
jgi:hypothetical protein